MYVEPYAFVYARTATWTFPRIDERDFEAFEGLEPTVSPVANLTNIQSISGAQEAIYLLKVGGLGQKVSGLDWFSSGIRGE